MDSPIHIVPILPLLAQLAALVCMAADRSVRRFPLVFCMILTLFLVSAGGNLAYRVLAPIPYSRFWVAGFVAAWSVIALALTDVSARSFESYRRFGRIGHRIIQGVLTASGLAILGSLFAPASWTRRFFEFFQAQGYLVPSSLAVLGLSVLTFAWLAGLKLRSSARLVVKIVTVFCCGEALLGCGISAAWPSTAFYVGVLWSTGCWATFAFLWARRPAETNDGPRRPLDARSAAEVLDRMQSTNSGLADMIRRG